MVRPINSVFLTIENLYQEEITFDSGVKLFIPTFLDRERYCASVAKVHSLPSKGYLGLKIGDEVAIAYNVIADYHIKGETVIYNRCYTFGEEVVWAADWLDIANKEHMVMSKKVGEEWKPIGNWCMVQEIEEEEIKSTLIIPDICKKKAKNKAKWYAGDMKIKKGETVYFGTGRRQDDPASLKNIYVMPDGKEFIFINKDYILGVL